MAFTHKKGYDFAVDRINSMGGVKVGGKSYKLAITYYDDESTPSRASQLTERLIQQDGVEFMLGPYSTTMTKAVAPVTEKFKVPMVEAEGASRSLFHPRVQIHVRGAVNVRILLSPGVGHYG